MDRFCFLSAIYYFVFTLAAEMPPAHRNNNKSESHKGKDDKNSSAQMEEVIQNAKSLFNLNICANSSYMDSLLTLHPYSLYQGLLLF